MHKKNFLLLLILVFQLPLFAQWTTLSTSPFSGRHDDICFINDSVGWIASGFGGRIFKTTDGGDSWNIQYFGNFYLRSIEFANDMLGFSGTLNGPLLRTTNGGANWTDVSINIDPKPPGICGLSAPSEEVIYGCGIWSSPAFLIKSEDGGLTWTNKDMSYLASALVDVHFTSPDTGFVCGRANPATEGGIILHTTDGGENWTILHKTMIPFDIIWKLQSPDGTNYFASIDAVPGTGNMRILKSGDSGFSWESVIVSDTYIYSQMIGFMDSLTGWVGGLSSLYETIDGGETWYPIALGSDYNRFLKINDTLAFMSGGRIYKYTKEETVSTQHPETYAEIHGLKVTPNPAADLIQIEIELSENTYCLLQIFSSNGHLIHDIYNGPIEKGKRNFSYHIGEIPPQSIYVALKTNEGLVYRKVIKM